MKIIFKTGDREITVDEPYPIVFEPGDIFQGIEYGVDYSVVRVGFLLTNVDSKSDSELMQFVDLEEHGFKL